MDHYSSHGTSVASDPQDCTVECGTSSVIKLTCPYCETFVYPWIWTSSGDLATGLCLSSLWVTCFSYAPYFDYASSHDFYFVADPDFCCVSYLEKTSPWI